MADEKTVAKTKDTAKVSFGTKFVNFCKRLPGKIATPFKNMWHELKKVTWPSKQDLIRYTLIVLAFLVFMGVVVGLLDMGSTALIKVLM